LSYDHSVKSSFDDSKNIAECAKILSDIAEIDVDEATNMLLQVMETYKIDPDKLDDVIEKLNSIN